MKYVPYTVNMENKWITIPSDNDIETTRQNLEKNGFTTIVTNTEEEATKEFFTLVPEGAEIFTVTSMTLETLGITKEVNQSGKFDAIRPKLMHMDRATQGEDMRKIGAAPAYVAGSVHAVTQDGHVLIASKTGSQLPAYVYGAGKVIWVVGAQKIVKDITEGQKRIFEHTLPLEGKRANKAYNITTGSSVDKLLTYYTELVSGRVTIILVKKELGF